MPSNLYNDLGVKTKKLTAKIHYFEQDSDLREYFEMSSKNWPFAKTEAFLNAYIVDLKRILVSDSLETILDSLKNLIDIVKKSAQNEYKIESQKMSDFFRNCQNMIQLELLQMNSHSEEEKKNWKYSLLSKLRLSIEEEIYFWQEEVVKRQTLKS